MAANYTVRITFEATADVVVKANNTIEAQEKARKAAPKAKPKSLTVRDLRVMNIEQPR